MKSFKDFFTEMTKKKKKEKSMIKQISRPDAEFYGRKAGAHQTKKSKELGKQRKNGKDQARNAMRGEY